MPLEGGDGRSQGVPYGRGWIPAFAGMTDRGGRVEGMEALQLGDGNAFAAVAGLGVVEHAHEGMPVEGVVDDVAQDAAAPSRG